MTSLQLYSSVHAWQGMGLCSSTFQQRAMKLFYLDRVIGYAGLVY